MNSSLSIVMPVYNEAGVIEKVVVGFCKEVLKEFDKKEFILVNDCSTDKTLEILKRIKSKYPYIKILNNQKNLGHGSSLMKAYREAKFDYIFHCDSDNQFKAEDFWKLWRQMEEGDLDLVMGHRLKRNDPFYRVLMSKLLIFFDFLLFGIFYRDANGPFKLYKRDSLNKILRAMPKNVFVPSILMVLAAHAFKMKIKEVPVSHLPRLTGKSFIRSWKILVFCWKAGKEIFAFRSKLQILLAS